VAEELCHLFREDESVDMTPVLRQSKEAARRQRAKPDDDDGRGEPALGRPGPDRPSKRRRPEEEYFRPKPSRGRPDRPRTTGPYPPMDQQGPSSMLVSRYATSGSVRGSSRSYEDYLRGADSFLPVRQNYQVPRGTPHYHPYAYGRPDLPKPIFFPERRGYDRGDVSDFYARSAGDRPRVDRTRKFHRR